MMGGSKMKLSKQMDIEILSNSMNKVDVKIGNESGSSIQNEISATGSYF